MLGWLVFYGGVLSWGEGVKLSFEISSKTTIPPRLLIKEEKILDGKKINNLCMNGFLTF